MDKFSLEGKHSATSNKPEASLLSRIHGIKYVGREVRVHSALHTPAVAMYDGACRILRRSRRNVELIAAGEQGVIH